MKFRKTKALIAFLSAFLLAGFGLQDAATVFAIPAEEDAKELAYVEGRDYSVKPIFNESTLTYDNADEYSNYYYYNAKANGGYSSPTVQSTWKGVTFDSKTNTFTVKNVKAPMLQIRIDGADNQDYHIVTEGNSQIGHINIFGGKTLYIEGTGVLELNAPITGTSYQVPDVGTALKNKSPFNEALAFSCRGEQVPSVQITDTATLKLYGQTGSESASSDSYPYSALFSFRGKNQNAASKIFTCNGTIDPALKWKDEVVDNSTVSLKYYSTQKTIYTKVDIPNDNIYTISGNDALYVAYYEDEPAYYKAPFLVRPLTKKGTDWYVGGLSEIKQLTELEFKAYKSVDQTTLTSIFPDGVKAYTELSNFSGTELKKQNNTYVLYSRYVFDGHITDVIFGEDADFWFIGRVTDNGTSVIVDDVTAATGLSTSPNYEEETTYFTKNGYSYENVVSEEEVYTYLTLTNTAQTFISNGKPADPGTVDQKSGDTTTGTGDQKTETPKSGDTIETDQGDFKLTEDKNGNMTAEYSANEKTDSQKTVTVPDVVEVNGEKVPVTAIADNAFSGNSKITNLKFKGKNLKKIGKNAFSKCKNLKQTVIPDSVTEIGAGAFDGDKKLAKVTVNGNTLKKIGKNAFRGVKKNAKITIKAKNDKIFKQVVKKIKKAGNKKLKFKFKKSKK